VPPADALAPLAARAAAAIRGAAPLSWNELALDVVARVLMLDDIDRPSSPPVARRALARITDVVRWIEREPHEAHTVDALATRAGVTPYHFLRTFERLTGVTPHQFVLRSRLRAAAERVLAHSGRIIDIAFACGFNDVSNFNRAFRSEFGMSPRAYRSQYGGS
jgi:AraC family transcriptional regulator